MIVVTGSVTAREDSFDEILRLSQEHVNRSRAEPGCIAHAVHVDCENPLRLVFFERWADRDALLKHFAVLAGLIVRAKKLGPLPLITDSDPGKGRRRDKTHPRASQAV